MCAFVCMCHGVYVEARGQFLGASSLLQWDLGLISVDQVCETVPLPATQSPWSAVFQMCVCMGEMSKLSYLSSAYTHFCTEIK